MAVKTQEELNTAISTNLADNTNAGISPEDVRTIITDLLDTAVDAWGADAASPLTSGLITAMLADNTAGDITPEDVRSIALNIVDVIYP